MEQKPPVLTDVSLNAVLSDQEALQALVHFIEPNPSYMVLDLGTGKGNTSIALAPHVEKVVAVDYGEDVVEACRKNVHAANLEEIIEVQKANVSDLNFPDQTFDLVTCRAAFHHFPNPSQVLSEVRRVMKDSGSLYLMDAVFSDYAKQVWTPVARIRETDLNSFYTYLDIMGMLDASGLRVTKLRPFLFKRVLDEWIGNAPEVIQKRLKEVVLTLDERILNELHFVERDGKWIYHYNVFELLAMKSIA